MGSAIGDMSIFHQIYTHVTGWDSPTIHSYKFNMGKNLVRAFIAPPQIGAISGQVCGAGIALVSGLEPNNPRQNVCLAQGQFAQLQAKMT